jgi:hypothetical protein
LRLIRQLIDIDTKAYGLTFFPLHDETYRRAWIQSWSTKTLLNLQDFTLIKDHIGEDIAFYFVYLQFYFVALSVPAALGFLEFSMESTNSIWFSVLGCIWALVYVELWERQEKDLASVWGVYEVHKNDPPRPQFKPDKWITDPITKQKVKYYPATKRMLRRFSTMPFLLMAGLLLLGMLTCIFVSEMVLTEYYQGPFKMYIQFLPTAVYAALMPQLSAWYARLSKRANDYENHETDEQYRNELVNKLFISHFVVNFGYPLMTGLLYIPFGPKIALMLKAMGFPVNVRDVSPTKFRDSVVAFIMTGQILNAFMEVLLPILIRWGNAAVAKMTKKVETTAPTDSLKPSKRQKLIETVLAEYILDDYDIDVDYGEMVMQFGYVVLFGPVWPLTAVRI